MAFKDRSLPGLFYDLESSHPNKVFLRQPFGDRWEEYTYKKAGDKMRRMVSYLHSLDLPKHTNIGIISKNCREWLIADLAFMISGHVSVPLYATLKEDTLAQVLDIGDVQVLFVGKLNNWDDLKNGVGSDVHMITFPQYQSVATIDRGEECIELMNNNGPMNPTMYQRIMTSLQ